MTTPVVTISPHASVAEAARRMSDLGIKRLPVVQRRRARGHRLQHRPRPGVRPLGRRDRREIREDILLRTLWLEVPEAVQVRGRARCRSTAAVRSETATDAVSWRSSSLGVPGVVSVHAEVGWRFDDETRTRRELERRPPDRHRGRPLLDHPDDRAGGAVVGCGRTATRTGAGPPRSRSGRGRHGSRGSASA